MIQTAVVALSALINALYETNMAIIVRKVYSAATAPKLGCLLPHIKSSYEVSPHQVIALGKVTSCHCMR